MSHVVHHCAAGQGLELAAPDATVTVKVDAEHTSGGYELFEVDAPRGPSVPPHTTPWPKAYYVLHGRMTVLVDGELYDLAPGSTITIPPDAAHTFTVVTPTVKFLVVSLTDAMGRFHADLQSTPPDELGELIERHGITMEGQ